MYNILLVCSAGMSTSLMVKKMEESARAQAIDVEIKAIAEAELKDYTEKVDIILLGPQVRYMLAKVKETMEPKGILVDVINSADYGMMRGEKVLNESIALIDGK